MADLEDSVCKMANILLNGQSHIKLLEAGCGSATHIKFMPEVYAVGIDISRDQLDKNTIVQEKLLGDIQDYPLPNEEFDVVMCWMVLEHLSRPKDALSNLFKSVKPRGLLILGFPNLLSIKGIVTKLTPFWFHTLFYKFMKYECHPFPTYLRVDILPDKVTRFAEDNGFSVEFCRLVEGTVTKKVRSRFWLADAAFSVADAVTKVVSFGRLRSPLLDACAIILRRRENVVKETCLAMGTPQQ